MIDKCAIWIAAFSAVLAVPSMAAAGNPNASHDEKSEKTVELSAVPKAAMDAAKTKLASVTSAELVTAKDGSTFYELTGTTKAGKTMKVQVKADGTLKQKSGY